MGLVDVLSQWWQEAAIPAGTAGGFLAGAKWQKRRSPSVSGYRAAATGGDDAPAVTTGDAAQTSTGDHSPNVNIENVTIFLPRMKPGDEATVEYDEGDDDD